MYMTTRDRDGQTAQFEPEAGKSPAKMPPLWLFLTILGSLPVMVLLVTDFNDSTGLIMGSGHIWGRDFANLWTGGRLVAEGQPHLVYSLQEYLAYQQEIIGPIKPHYYSYPPSSLFLAAPFGLLPYTAALAAWLIGTLAFFLWAARPFVKAVPNYPLYFAALTPAATINIWAGHYGFLVGGLWLACFARIQLRPERAGVFAALLTIKPHLGLLIPPILLARRAWRTILVAAAGTIALVVASGLVFGFGLWAEYLTKMSRFQAALLEDHTSFFLAMMPGSFTSLRYTMGATETVAWSVHVVVALAAMWLCWTAVRRGAPLHRLAFIAATATFLILPYAFDYDMTVVSLGFALLLFERWEGLPVWQREVRIAGYLTPQLTFIGKMVALPLTPAILLVGLYLQVRLCSNAAEKAPELQPA